MGCIGRIFRRNYENDENDNNKVLNILYSMGFKHHNKSGNTIKYKLLSDETISYGEELFYKEMNVYFLGDVVKGMKGYEHLNNLYTYLFLEENGSDGLLTLNFLHSYFSLFRYDLFWNCYDYIFEKKDIEKMYAYEKKERYWMYNNPEFF